MATTTYFEGVVKDARDRTKPIELEFGTCSAYGGTTRLYLRINGGEMIIADDQTERAICEAMSDLISCLATSDAA